MAFIPTGWAAVELIEQDNIKQLMIIIHKLLVAATFSLLLGLAPLIYANDRVDTLLAGNAAPEGVIFEIATGDNDALARAIPAIQRYSDALRKKFPGLSIAVVTHGREQFSLSKDNAGQYNGIHKKVKSLVRDSNIDVHVCGAYAGWEGLVAEDFPDYIDVAAAGPVQVNDYRALGYVLIPVDGSE